MTMTMKIIIIIFGYEFSLCSAYCICDHLAKWIAYNVICYCCCLLVISIVAALRQMQCNAIYIMNKWVEKNKSRIITAQLLQCRCHHHDHHRQHKTPTYFIDYDIIVFFISYAIHFYSSPTFLRVLYFRSISSSFFFLHREIASLFCVWQFISFAANCQSVLNSYSQMQANEQINSKKKKSIY